jgi:hypothetical protein
LILTPEDRQRFGLAGPSIAIGSGDCTPRADHLGLR